MNVDEERSRSPWLDDAPEIPAPAFQGPAETDIVVIGAGMAGLSTAYALTRRGYRVIVLDRGQVARGVSARTTAHLVSELDDFYYKLAERRDKEIARLFAASQRAAIDAIEATVRAEHIECDFARTDGYLFAPSKDRIDELEQEYEAARAAGMPVAWAERAPFLGYDTGKCLRFAAQARMHPLKYLAGLGDAIAKQGGLIYANSPVCSVEEHDAFVRVGLQSGGEIDAAHVVVASNSPFNDRVAIHTKQAPYRTYAMAFEAPKGAVYDALMWDTLDPYHYVRIQPRALGDLVIIGGEDHRSGLADDGAIRFANLEAWSRARFPELGVITHAWSGQIYEPVDFLPFIGRNPGDRRVFVITGDSGQGMTMGATAGLLIPDLIEGAENAWEKVFEPSRKSLASAPTYLDENKVVIGDLSEYAFARAKASADDIAPGEGALLRDGARLLAAYRNAAGELFVRAAACTHMGCIVHWNSFEQCWDCPCHGSQYSAEGEVLQGPAFAPLAPAEKVEARDAQHRAEQPRA